MPLNKASLGVSLHGDLAEVIYLRRDWRGWHIVDRAAYPFPGRPEEEAAFSQDVQKFLLKNGVSSHDPVVLGLPRTDVLFRHFTTPAVPDKDLPGLVSFEAERHLPGRKDEFVVGHQVTGRSADGGHEILMGAVKRSVITRYLNVLRKANIVPRSVQPAAMGLAAAFRNSGRREGTAVVVTTEETSFAVDRLEGGRLVESRHFSVDRSGEEEGGDDRQTLQEAAEAVTGRLTHPLFLESLPGGKLPPLFLEGAPERTAALAEMLEGRIGDTAVEAFRAPAGSGRAFGLALLGLGVEKGSLELSDEESEGLTDKPRYRASLALVVLLAGILGVTFGIGLMRNYRALSSIEKEVARLKEEKAVVEGLSRVVQEKRARLDFLRESISGRTSQAELLRELTGLIPEDTHLTDYTFRGGALEISGLSPSASRLIPLLEASPYFQEASFSSAIVSQGKELERFKIRLNLEERKNG